MSETPKSVTCAERVTMNLVAGILFIIVGYAIIAYGVFSDKSGTLGATITIICGFIGFCYGLYYLCCYRNRAIAVSDEGVVYRNWMGKVSRYSWDQVTVEQKPGRNAKFIFTLNGKNISFFGYCKNALALHEWLYESDHYGPDTMRAIHKSLEQEEELIRAMQKKAKEHGAEWDDEDDLDD